MKKKWQVGQSVYGPKEHYRVTRIGRKYVYIENVREQWPVEYRYDVKTGKADRVYGWAPAPYIAPSEKDLKAALEANQAKDRHKQYERDTRIHMRNVLDVFNHYWGDCTVSMETLKQLNAALDAVEREMKGAK